jgi:glycosyltransferase involved in cell wall biosynthesis
MKILIVDNGIAFDLQTPYNQCLGGSETTALLLAKGLSNLSHQVVLLTNATTKDQNGYLMLDNINNFYEYAKISDVILLNRFVPPTIMDFVQTKKVFYISHDAYDQDIIRWLMNANAEQYLNKVICVSEWQRQTFIDYMRADPEKLIVLGNPIDYSLHQGFTERDLNKLVFTSIPYKGLEIIPDLFNEIKIKSKNDKLYINIYSSFELYGNKDEDQQFIEVFQKLNNMKDVNLFKPISMKELAYVFKTSNLNIAPSLYHETFGRIFVEAAASGCLTVCMNNGANKEVLQEHGFILDYANIFNAEAFDCFVSKVCELIDRDLYSMRVKAEREMKKWDYMILSKRLEKILAE